MYTDFKISIFSALAKEQSIPCTMDNFRSFSSADFFSGTTIQISNKVPEMKKVNPYRAKKNASENVVC